MKSPIFASIVAAVALASAPAFAQTPPPPVGPLASLFASNAALLPLTVVGGIAVIGTVAVNNSTSTGTVPQKTN